MKDEFQSGPIIDRMREAVGVKKDADLAVVLNVAPGTIATWRKRNSVPYEHCLSLSVNHGVSLNWLLLGYGEMPMMKRPIVRMDLSLLARIIITLELGLQETYKNEPVPLRPDEKASWICSTYRFWVAKLDEVLETTDLSREEAIDLLQKVLPEGYRLRDNSPTDLRSDSSQEGCQ